MLTRTRILLLILALLLAVALLSATLVVRGRIEARVGDRVACRFDGEPQVSVSSWRALTALATGDLGDVRVQLADVVGDADLELLMHGVSRADDGVDFTSAEARLAMPLSGLDVPVTAEDGKLVASREVLGSSLDVVLVPHLDQTVVSFTVESMLLGNRTLGGRFAEQLAGALPSIDLADRMPAGLTPTGLEVTDDALVVEASIEPGAIGGATGNAAC